MNHHGTLYSSVALQKKKYSYSCRRWTKNRVEKHVFEVGYLGWDILITKIGTKKCHAIHAKNLFIYKPPAKRLLSSSSRQNEQKSILPHKTRVSNHTKSQNILTFWMIKLSATNKFEMICSIVLGQRLSQVNFVGYNLLFTRSQQLISIFRFSTHQLSRYC